MTTKFPSHINLPRESRAELIELLNVCLATSIDLHWQVKQAHWTIVGPNFIARPYLYANAALVPVKSRGMWQRRFLSSFERERDRGCENDRDWAGGCPAQWLRKARHVAWADPAKRDR